MSAPSSEQLKQLQAFVELCKANPSILHLNEFKFFKDYIESLGGRVPAGATGPKSAPSASKPEPKVFEPEPEPEVESEESEVELDNEGVIGSTLHSTKYMTNLILLCVSSIVVMESNLNFLFLSFF